MNRRTSIGFDRKLRLEWLDATAAKAADGATVDELRAFLLEHLDSLAYQSDTAGNARDKTARVLLRIWGNVEPKLESLHQRALQLLSEVAPQERIGIHWAMTLAAYPYFADHAAVVGRLLALHGSFTTAQIQRRIAEQWGDRSTVVRTSRHVLRTMVVWGVLEDIGKGVYGQKRRRLPAGAELTELLVESILLDSESDTIAFEHADQHPMLFPFDVRINMQTLRKSRHVRLFRQGLDSDYLMLDR